MTNEQKRLEVYNAIDQYLGSFMIQNQVSASMMEDALNKCMLNLKDRVAQEFIEAALQESAMLTQMTAEEDNG